MALVQVVPDGLSWKVVVDGQQDGPLYEDQDDADQVGRSVAKSIKAEYQLHGRDGRIREKDSYGNDPRDVKG